MAKVFYLSEIVNFAIEKEQQSYDLYKELAAKAKDEESKKLFEHLMDQEKHHKEIYAEMLRHVEKEMSPGAEENDEYVAYMEQLIADSRKLSPVSKLDFSDLDAVIDYAIGREKDSILFYVGLKNFVLPHTHAHIDDIIAEEGRHIAALLSLL